MTLKSYRYNQKSQNGEDGFITEIFRRLGINGGYVVEFGAADGLWLSNTANLWQNGYEALLIESDVEKYDGLVKNTGAYPNVSILNAAVSEDPTNKYCLNNIFKIFEVPLDFELLSIDVDGADYAIWESLRDYSPKVVIMEANSSFGPQIMHISNGHDEGCSAAAIVELARDKGYELVVHCGNCIFVRSDLYGSMGMHNNELTTLWGW